MNKFPHLYKYAEFILHLSVWLIVGGLILKSTDNYWHNQYQEDTGLRYYEDIGNYMIWLDEHYKYGLLIRYIILILFKAVFAYVNIYLIFPRFERVMPRWKVLQPLAFNFFWCFLAEVIVYDLARRSVFPYPNDPFHWMTNHEEIESFILFFITLISSYAYWASKQWILNKGNIEQLGKTNAELALLKNQINPHFLFNTLNNLFSMAIERKADDLAESISQLTHLMRYSIYESRTEYIELHREVEYLENYIKLQKLRFSSDDAVSIRFQVYGETQSVRIAPMLLINFVENAFKHGVSLKQPSLINIALTTTEDQISFIVENTIHRQNTESSVAHAGFGLEHTKKLLAMQYPHRHQLQITEDQNIFRVDLVLKLQRTKVEVMA